MSQKSRIPRIHIKRRVELSSLQNEPSSAHNEPESSETSKKNVDIFSLKEKYNIRLSQSYKEQTSAPQTVHFSKELESTIPETVDELKTKNRKLKEEIAELKRQNSQMEIDFEEKLEKNDSSTELEIISLKRPKGRKLKSKKIVKTNKEKRVFGNDSEEEDTESDDEKNEKATARMRNSEKLLKDLRHKKIHCIKVSKELFRKNNPNIINYDKELLLQMLADRAFHSPEMSDTGEEDNSKTVWYNFSPPAKAPNWTCNEQKDIFYNIEFVQTEGEDEPSFVSTSSSKISAEQ
ncbi:hypothetical protein Glove_744g15 [Diversispora epigaea]|uniref:Uncharacterized protein n=1 Tax=Diversispora epigaea TaxID=1348612 RepID=A0A397G3W1_9GLOM|nr:hypothetical protein Glove_744g15 [Diversispora epigaea]